MTDIQAERRGRRLKTWSSFGNLGRVPSEYEVVTHQMNHTTGATPLEMGANVHGNQWLLKHRDGMSLTRDSLEAFRDPDRMTYRKYTHDMDGQETYIDGLLQEFTVSHASDAALTPRSLDFLQNCLTTCRYLGHGLQMMSAYVQQLAPSSYIANCAAFQTADQLRRVQWVAYRTKQLDLAHPARGFGRGERAIWETRDAWQPARKAVEQLLVTYDWDDAFVGLNLVVKPLADEIFLKAFALVAREFGDELDALINDNLFLDAERSRRWTVALCACVSDGGEANRQALRKLLKKWIPAGEAVAVAGGRLLAAYSKRLTVDALDTQIVAGWSKLIAEAGLAYDA